MPELHVLAGPNGSGKSSFTQQVRDGSRTIDYVIPPVINPDVIALRINPSDPDAAALAAGREAVQRRAAAIINRESFAIETTLSGNAELKTISDAREAGYSVTMTYVAVKSAEMSLARVITRAKEEKRTVPHDVVLRRYPRSFAHLAAIVSELDRVDVYDNSATELKSVARLERGRVVKAADEMPAWAEQVLREPLAVARDRATVGRAAIAHLSATPSSTSQAIVEEDVRRRGRVAGNVIAQSEHHVAIGTTPWSYAILERRNLDRQPTFQERVRIDLKDGQGRVREPNDNAHHWSRKPGR